MGKFEVKRDCYSALVEPQVWIHRGVPRRGEKVQIGLGRSGYVEWNGDYRSVPGFTTARLKLAYDRYEIVVEERQRRRGIGRQLLEEVVRQARKNGFECLVVLGGYR